eukprot:3531379-Amphidinium_carterae.1
MIERASTCKSAMFSAEAVLEVLGIEFSRKATKGMPFNVQFKLLGVQVNLAARVGLSRVTFTLASTPERQLRCSLITPPAAARLAGRLTLLSGIGTHGKYEAACMVMLRVLESGDGVVPVSSEGPSLWVFSAASPENADSDSKMQEVLIGGVIYVRGTTKPLSYFSERVPDFVVKHWASSRKQVIAQAELFAVL